MARIGVDFVTKHIPDVKDPLSDRYDWYVLMEVTSALADIDLKSRLTGFLEKNLASGHVLDGAVAESAAQRAALWRIREGIPEAQKPEGGSIKHDISVPVSSIPEFLRRAEKAVLAHMPDVRPVPFGHVGDGNVHYNLSQPPAMARDDFIAQWADFNEIVHNIVADLGGSISAEHGIGRMKVTELERYKDPVALNVMRELKRTLDPHNILNPGKILSA